MTYDYMYFSHCGQVGCQLDISKININPKYDPTKEIFITFKVKNYFYYFNFEKIDN